MEQRNDFEFVHQVVEMVTGYKIFATNRKRKTVESRMLFSLLMIELGYPLTHVGEYLGKDHTTIIHYKRVMRNLLDTDTLMLRRYLKCKEIIVSEKQPLILISDTDYKTETQRLQSKIEILKAENYLLNEEKNELIRQINVAEERRFVKIFNLIADNTPIGHELIVERKIRKMFDD